MERDRKRALIAAYKERKARPGVFAVRCPAAGLVWVGRARELANRQNGIWAALRFRGSPFASLQAAWSAHGEAAFVYEELEELEAEGLDGWALDQALKARAAAWCARLGATAI